MEKVIITVATTGSWPKKEITPHVPYTPEEIADDAVRCWEAGASIVHLHMRDQNGVGIASVELFEETQERIRSRSDIVLNMTTAGDRKASEEQRYAAAAKLKPEMASLDCGSTNIGDRVFINSRPFLEKLAKVQLDNGIKPEIEVFDAGMVYNALSLIKQGLITQPAHYQFCMGVQGGIAATVDNLVFLKNLLPQDATWGAFGISKWHLPIMLAAIAMGGHVRVGLEDNIYYSKGVLATNLALVERAVRLIREGGREVATPDDTRKILGLRGIKTNT